MRSAWCWSACQNQFRDPGGIEQCHHCSLKPLRLQNNFSPSVLSEVISGWTGSRLMAGISAGPLLERSSVSPLLSIFYIHSLVSSVLCLSTFLLCFYHLSLLYCTCTVLHVLHCMVRFKIADWNLLLKYLLYTLIYTVFSYMFWSQHG